MTTAAPSLASSHPPAQPPAQVASPDPVPFWRSGAILGVTIAMALLLGLAPNTNLSPQAGVVLNLPDEVGDFIGLSTPMSEAETKLLPSDTGFARKDYKDFKGDEIVGTIILSGAEQRSIHRPEVCLVAQGWTIIDQRDIPVTLNSGHPLVVRCLDVERANVLPDNSRIMIRAYYLYWFVGENITTPSHFQRVFLSAWDRAINNVYHRWAYVTFLSPITRSFNPNGKSDAETEKMLTDFIRGSIATFQKSEMVSR